MFSANQKFAANPGFRQKKCRIYARVSMRKGVVDLSTERQIEMGLERARERGEAPVIYEEPVGHNSGKNEKRAKWQELWRDCEREPAETGSVVVCNLARFSRADNVMELLRQLKRSDIEFIDLDDEFDIDTYEGRRLVRTKAMQNSQYADDISHWVSKAVKKHKERGWYWGRPPLGLKTELNADGKGKHLAPSGETYQTRDGETRTFLDTVIAYCRLRHEERLGRTEAALRLRSAGYKWRSKSGRLGQGKPAIIFPSHLQRLDPSLPRYAGFVDDEILRGAISLAAERAGRRMNGNAPRETFVLARLLYCEGCNQRLRQGVSTSLRSAQHPEQGRRDYRFYQHRARFDAPFENGPCEKPKQFNAERLEEKIWDMLRRLNDLTPAQQRAAAERMTEQDIEDRAALDARLKREALEKRIANLIRMLADEDMDASDVKPLLAATKQELANLPAPAPLPARQIARTPDDALALLKHISTIALRAADLESGLGNRLMHTVFRRIVINLEGEIVDWDLQSDLVGWFPVEKNVLAENAH